ncbi:hypothetical protein B9Z19DRAFT_984070 [Tuber borchii]|uniref:F-box domain-containing protein n=1 Tax=Tuber borchii TaxID=42251 RepID=A0A2T6ZRS8_TUBBO|nr:hypothetical protein B9Z19DRAFT_984070 [Tuber borchii]
MPKAHENDKASSIAKSKVVPNPPGGSSSGGGGSIAFHAKNSKRENSRGSHLAQERSTVVKGDDKAGAANAPRPLKLPVAYSDHVQNITHSKERDDWRNRRSLPTTHGARTVLREAKAELSQSGDDAGDNKNDGGVSLEILGPRASVDTPPQSFHPPQRKADVVAHTPNTTRIDNRARSISVEPPKTTCPQGNPKYANSSGGGCGFRSPKALIPPTAYHERVITNDSNHLIEASRTIGRGIEPKPPISGSLKEFLKTPRRNTKGGELFQISSSGARFPDWFARLYASDPDAIQDKYGHLGFLLQADPRGNFSKLRYTVDTHRSMFWQLDPVRLHGVDPEKIKPEASPKDKVTGGFAQKASGGVSTSSQGPSEWGLGDVSQNPHCRYNQIARTTSEYSVSTGGASPCPAEATPKEHGGSYPSKNQLSRNDRACAILEGRRGACSGNRYNDQFRAIPADVDRVSLGKKGGAFSDRSVINTAVPTRTLTGIDRAVTVGSLDLTTLKHKGLFSENNPTFHPNTRAPEHASSEFAQRSEESETLLEPVVKKPVTEVYIPYETLDVEGATILPSANNPAPSIISDPSSLISSLPDSPAPLLGEKRQSTGSGDEGSLAIRKTGDCIQAGGKSIKSNTSTTKECSARDITNYFGITVPPKPEKPLGPPVGSQMPCLTSQDEAKMALAVSLQKPGQFVAKGESDPQRSDPEAEEVLPWMNESDSGNETPSVLEWDWDKKSSQTGLTDDEWNVGVPLDQAIIESFDGAVENKTGRVFELPEDPGSPPNPRKQETRKRGCVKKYRAKESKEPPRTSEGKDCESPMPANNAGEPQASGNSVVKQPALEHRASKPPAPENKARKPPVSHHKVNKPPVPVNRTSESTMSKGANGKSAVSEGRNRNPPRSRNNGDAGESNSRRCSPRGCSGIKKLPEEVLHAIFSYAADGVLPEVQVKTKDLTYGCGFEAPSNFNKIRYKGLYSVLRTCRRWRTLGQEILCKYVNLSEWSNLELFARTVSQNQDVGALVRSLRISVRPFSPQASYQSYNNRDRNSRTVPVEQVDTLRFLPDMMQGCSLIHVMSIDMPNVVPAFNRLVSKQKFPNLREIRMKDGGERIATGERVWESIIRNTPELKKLVITQDQDLSLRNAPTLIKIPENIFHSEKASTFRLTQIHLTRSYEITDDILLLLCGKLSSLNDLLIIDCPLVTSRGIAQVLKKMPNQLTRLSFWIWVNHYGNISKREQEIGVDLCHALSKYGQSLQHMDIKMFLACHHLWQDGFRELKRCRIVPVHYHDCVEQKNIRSSDFFKNVLDEGRNAGKFPALTECRV